MARWRMWGFDNGGDLSYELNKNAEIYQWSAGVQRLLPWRHRGQRRLFGESQHASALGQLCRGHPKPQLRSDQHPPELTLRMT